MLMVVISAVLKTACAIIGQIAFMLMQERRSVVGD